MNVALRSAFIVLPAVLSLLTGCDMAAEIEESHAHATPIAGESPRVQQGADFAHHRIRVSEVAN